MWCPNSVGRRKRPFQPFIIDSVLDGQFKVILLMFLSCLLLKASSPNKKSPNTGQVMLSPENKRGKVCTKKVVPETLPGIYLDYTLAELCSPEESINSVNRSLLEPLAAMRGYMVQTLSRSVTAAVCRNTLPWWTRIYSEGFCRYLPGSHMSQFDPTVLNMQLETSRHCCNHSAMSEGLIATWVSTRGELTICYHSLQFDSVNNKTGYS